MRPGEYMSPWHIFGATFIVWHDFGQTQRGSVTVPGKQYGGATRAAYHHRQDSCFSSSPSSQRHKTCISKHARRLSLLRALMLTIRDVRILDGVYVCPMDQKPSA